LTSLDATFSSAPPPGTTFGITGCSDAQNGCSVSVDQTTVSWLGSVQIAPGDNYEITATGTFFGTAPATPVNVCYANVTASTSAGPLNAGPSACVDVGP
jgi:hypothetical protein